MAKTLIRITTVPMALKALIAGQPRFMRENGFNVILVSAGGKEIEEVKKMEGCEHIVVPMTRKITPLQDVKCLMQLIKIFKKYKPDIVHTHTPKAGLLGMIAAKRAGIKIRIHTVAGLPLETATGLKKKILLFTEKLTYRAATNVWPNSFSIERIIKKEKLTGDNKLQVINHGSSNGVDLQKFSTQNLLPGKMAATKKLLAKKENTITILFVGRLVKDKGVTELINVFKKLRKNYLLTLVLVGPYENDLDPLPEEIIAAIKNDASIKHIYWSNEIEYLMNECDLLVHPSHREGFSNVILQAGAMQLPVICSNIAGNNDIVQHKKTGLLFTKESEEELLKNLTFALTNPAEMKQFSTQLYLHVIELFDRKKMQSAILSTYNSLLKNLDNN